MLQYQAKQFCRNTALHGYRYITLPQRTLLERIFWIFVVLTSLAIVLVLVTIAWIHFQKDPTILVTDFTQYPIWNYPFPAVTICSYNKLSKNRTYQLAAKIITKKNTSLDFAAWELRALIQLISRNNQSVSIKNLRSLQDYFDLHDVKIEEILRNLAPQCSEILQKCKWKGEEQRCEIMFEQIPTSEGFCCSFNYFALRNHTFGGLLPNRIAKKPQRVSACGHLTALEVLIKSNPNDYFASILPSIGHSVYIHDSYHFPDWTIQTVLTPENTINLIGINPTITLSTRSVKELNVRKRHCLFENERQLHSFATYNFHNCLIECRMNITKQLCNCIEFFNYNPNGNYPKTEICNLRNIACLQKNKRLIASSVPGFDPEKNHNWGTKINNCDCLPDCEYVQYVGETSSATKQFFSNKPNLLDETTSENLSTIRVFFNDVVATKNRRDIHFGWHTLLAYYGGLLGLFIGFSFISAVEIIYTFTVRFLANLYSRKQRKQERSRNLPLNFEFLYEN